MNLGRNLKDYREDSTQEHLREIFQAKQGKVVELF